VDDVRTAPSRNPLLTTSSMITAPAQRSRMVSVAFGLELASAPGGHAGLDIADFQTGKCRCRGKLGDDLL